ncbi:MAG: hypothetical protein WC929_08730 [Bacilli bacterium]
MTENDIDPASALAVIDVELNEIELCSVGSGVGFGSSFESHPIIHNTQTIPARDKHFKSFIIIEF